MRLTVIHDSQGTIHSIIASPPDAPPAHADSRAGEFVSEIDEPELRGDAGDEAVHKRLAEITKDYRIEERPAGRLTSKSPT